MQEAAGAADVNGGGGATEIDLYCVDRGGAPTCLRVAGFRNFFYLQMAPPPPPPPPPSHSYGRGVSPRLLRRRRRRWGAGHAIRPQSHPRAFAPRRLLVHLAGAVCKAWRDAAASVLCEAASRATERYLPPRAAAASPSRAKGGKAKASAPTAAEEETPRRVEMSLVWRTPLLAYYGELMANGRRGGGGGGGGSAAGPPPTTAPPHGGAPLAGGDRSVPMLRATYNGRTKPDEILTAWKRLAAEEEWRGLLALTAAAPISSRTRWPRAGGNDAAAPPLRHRARPRRRRG